MPHVLPEWSDAVFRVIDLETTGLSPESAGICEIAWRDVDSSGAKVGLCDQQSLINPGRPIPPEASAVHHIVDGDVKHAPVIDEVLPRLLEAPDDRPLIFVAHNAEFERAFLPMIDRWICTYRLSLHLFPALPQHGLQYLRYALSLSPDISRTQPVHRAGADVAVTAPLLAACLAQLDKQRVPTVEDLVGFAEAPALLHRVPFKSSDFIPFEEAESSLLEWIIDRDAGGRDCVHTAHHQLTSRRAAWFQALDTEDPSPSAECAPADPDELPF